MNSWLILSVTLTKARKALPLAEMPVARNQLSEWLEALPLRVHGEANTACRQFATTKHWPPAAIADKDILVLIQLRLECAADYCRSQVRAPNPKEEQTEEEVLFWLLIVFWNDAATHWLRYRFEE